MTIEELMGWGLKLRFPAVRMKRGMVLMAGQKNWSLYMTHSTHKQRQLLADAIWCGPAQGLGLVGILE